jgi:translation initiation factor IF-1
VPSEDAINVEGTVVEVLGKALFRVQLANGHEVLAHAARRDRDSVGGLKPPDKVKLQMSPFDMSAGRILV